MFSLGAIPTSSSILRAGQMYTFNMITSNIIGKPLESTVLAALRENDTIHSVAQIVSVRNPLFTRNYIIVVNMTQGFPFGALAQILQSIFKEQLGYDASFIDVIGGAQADIPSPLGLPSVESTFSTVKWVAIAGVVVVSAVYLGPLIKAFTPTGRRANG